MRRSASGTSPSEMARVAELQTSFTPLAASFQILGPGLLRRPRDPQPRDDRDRRLTLQRLDLRTTIGAVREPIHHQGPVGGVNQPVFLHPGLLVCVALLTLIFRGGARGQDLYDPVRGTPATGIERIRAPIYPVI